MDPGVFPLPFTSHLDDNCVDDSAPGEARMKSNAQRAPARTIMAFCLYLYRRRFARVTSDRERISRSLITRNNRKIPFPVPCVSVETFLSFLNSSTRSGSSNCSSFLLLCIFFSFFFLSLFPSSFSLFLFIINAMETPNIERFCLMFQLFRRKQ